jgi:hypothetical protein
MKHRYLAASVDGVVQLIAASYLRHGYYWYVTGRIPLHKDPMSVDEKLIEKYQIDVSDWERSRRKKAGIANAQYVRCERWFVIMVTEGHHPLKQTTDKGGEGSQLKDVRRYPIRIGGYSISYRRHGESQKLDAAAEEKTVKPDVRYRAHVRIDEKTYAYLKARFADIAVHRRAETLVSEFQSLPYARYAPVRRQLLNLARMVNDRRKPHGFDPIPYTRIGLRRTPVKVYQETTIDRGDAK